MTPRTRSAIIAWVGLALRLYVGGVFLLACYHKLLRPDLFALDIATYQVLPLWAVNLVAVVLPWVELAAGLMLVAGLRVRAAALLVAGMMVVFMVALAFALAKGFDMSCGCFASSGVEEDPISGETLVRDAVWLAMAVFVLLLDVRPLGADRWLTTSR